MSLSKDKISAWVEIHPKEKSEYVPNPIDQASLTPKEIEKFMKDELPAPDEHVQKMLGKDIDAHMTLLYLGNLDQEKYDIYQLEADMSAFFEARPPPSKFFEFTADEIGQFGDQFIILLLEPSQNSTKFVYALRDLFKETCPELAVRDWKPHITMYDYSIRDTSKTEEQKKKYKEKLEEQKAACRAMMSKIRGSLSDKDVSQVYHFYGSTLLADKEIHLNIRNKSKGGEVETFKKWSFNTSQ